MSLRRRGASVSRDGHGCHMNEEDCSLRSGKPTAKDSNVLRRLIIGCVLTALFMVVEMVAGKVANSVAIFSDAAHMLSDVFGFLISIGAAVMARRASGAAYSYGYHRLEVLGALTSVLIIWLVTGILVYEAVLRVITPNYVDGKVMFIIGVSGLVFNVLVMAILGVHGHLGGQCDHDHGHGEHHGCGGHGHNHGHSHEHSQEHSQEHSHAHSQECSHEHSHEQSHGHSQQHSHRHSQKHGHGHSQHSGEPNIAHRAPGPHQHSTCNDNIANNSNRRSTCSGESNTRVDGSATAKDVAAVASPGIDSSIPLSCGVEGHPQSCNCTIRQISSREIEVCVQSPVVENCGQHGALGQARPTHSHSHKQEGNINLRSAMIHVLGDAVQSVGVAIAGGMIWANQHKPSWYLVDPIVTFVFAVLVLLTTRVILRDIFNTLMERAPKQVDVASISSGMVGIPGVCDVHDFHVWQISMGLPVMTAHVHLEEQANARQVMSDLQAYLRGLGITHTTVQVCNPMPTNVCSQCQSAGEAQSSAT